MEDLQERVEHQMTPDDLKQYLKDNLTIEVTKSAGGFTDPNGHNIVLKIDGEEICSTYFSMEIYPEYEG